MTGDALEPRGVDPRLIERFALFREPGPGPDGPLDEGEREVLALRAELFATAPRRQLRERVAAKRLIFGEVRKVVLDAERVILVIPGGAGLHVLVRSAKHGSTAGAGASIEGCLQGRPILSLGRTLVGLAPDGVDRQPVELRDGRIGHASVRHNTYVIDDPSWEP